MAANRQFRIDRDYLYPVPVSYTHLDVYKRQGQKYNGDLQVNAVDIEKNAGMETRDYETFTNKVNLQVKNVFKGLTLDLIGWRNQNSYNMENNSRSLYWYGRSVNTVRFSINTPNSMSMIKNKAYQNKMCIRDRIINQYYFLSRVFGVVL